MKHYIFLLLTLFLVACAEKDLTGDGPAGPRTGLRLSARLGQGTLTRAVGDPFASGKEEKRIDRLAFFVHTAEDGFQVYPPAPDDGSTTIDDDPYSVHLKETATDSRQYTADVVLTDGGGYVADIIAVANLPKDYDYNQIVSWQGLQDSVLVWTTEMPSCNPGSTGALADVDRRAFVMYGYVRQELEKESTNALSLAMERLVARIDITNEAYVQGMTPADPKGGFQLSSVRLLRARPASYLVPQMDYASPDVQTVSDWTVTNIPFGKPTSAAADVNPTCEPDLVPDAQAPAQATLQYLWQTLYTYENSDTEHAPTALEIKGLFRGMEVTRQIPFIDKDNQPLPIVRNHRYLVRILPAPGLTDITYDVKVAEWDAVDTVNVKPDQTEVPVIARIDGNGVYVDSIKRYDVYYKSNGVLTFDATCNFSAGVRVKYYDQAHDSWTTQDDWITVEKTAETPTTKAGDTYKSSFKITFDKYETGLPRKAMLLVHNGGSEVECDTIYIKHTLTYPGTELEPGRVGELNGKQLVWAPVNVGAIRLPTKDEPFGKNYELGSEELQNEIEEHGYRFQWGRRFGFAPTIKAPYIEGPVSKEKLIANYDMENVFIAPGSGMDWLDPSDNSLWGDGIKKGLSDPCPGGWRVPTKEEFEVLFKVMKDRGTMAEDNVNISVPELQLWQTADFDWNERYGLVTLNKRVTYWTSTIDSDNSINMNNQWAVHAYIGYDKDIQLVSLPKSGGYSVRCIQEHQ